MYTLKGNANKLLVKTRRGLSQGIESGPIVGRDSPEKTKLIASTSVAPRPVFHSNRSRYDNANSTGHQTGHHRNHQPQQDMITPEHQALIKYMSGQWRCVKKEFDEGGNMSNCLAGNSGSIRNKVPKTSIKNFEPFDLEAFWGQRLFQNLVQSSPL